MKIILSKDRAAQLDLLLTSLERHAEPEELSIIYRSTSKPFAQAYSILWQERRGRERKWLGPQMGDGGFEDLVRSCLIHAENTSDEFVTFLCDDDVYYRPDEWIGPNQRLVSERVLCFSLRLGQNTTECYPTGASTDWPGVAWDWRGLPPDFGYPGSLDGHIFRTADVVRMLDGKKFTNPTALECALVEGCNELADERPLMACYPHSVLVGVPVNRVSEQSNVRYGGSLIYSAENLNESYLQGMRLDLDGIDFSGVNGAHTELDLRWRVPVVN